MEKEIQQRHLYKKIYEKTNVVACVINMNVTRAFRYWLSIRRSCFGEEERP